MFYIIKYLSNKANETLSLFILKLFHFSDYILDPSCSQCRKWNIWNITATCTAILLNSSGFSAKLRSADFFDVKSFTMMSLLLSQNLIQLIYIYPIFTIILYNFLKQVILFWWKTHIPIKFIFVLYRKIKNLSHFVFGQFYLW